MGRLGRNAACPISMGRGTRRVHSVRREGEGGGGVQERSVTGEGRLSSGVIPALRREPTRPRPGVWIVGRWNDETCNNGGRWSCKWNCSARGVGGSALRAWQRVNGWHCTAERAGGWVGSRQCPPRMALRLSLRQRTASPAALAGCLTAFRPRPPDWLGSRVRSRQRGLLEQRHLHKDFNRHTWWPRSRTSLLLSASPRDSAPSFGWSLTSVSGRAEFASVESESPEDGDKSDDAEEADDAVRLVPSSSAR
jgi:hypothetical protein